ncbi:MAG: GNAT family protein [Proteobacteria bacterium]|nr:GNAT family protein [Pseudomonadota bacterium]
MWASYISCCAVPSAGTNSALAVADGYALRPAAPDDAPALLRFGELLLAESSYFLRAPGERARSVAEMRAIIDHFCAQPHYLLLSVWQGETTVGEAVVTAGEFQRNRFSATIGVGVLQAHSGRGLGAALMREMESFARGRRLRRLELTVMAPNARARALYERMGYVEEGLKRDSMFVDGGFVDEVMMAKILA